MRCSVSSYRSLVRYSSGDSVSNVFGRRLMRDPVTCNVDGCTRVTKNRYWCDFHRNEVTPRITKPRRPKLPAGKFRTGHGYVMVWTEPRFPGSRPYGKGWAILEHHKVMGEMIGRALLPGESVRHDNHVRDDNEPENLVLMLGGSPAMNQFDRAREIVARYSELFGTVNSHAA